MNRDPILFRVDATTATGCERLGRCITYAAALQRRRRPTFFLSLLEPGATGLAIKRAGNEWLEADGIAGTEEDLAETIQEVRRLRPAAIVVDGPDIPQTYLSELVAAGTLVVSIDHLASQCFPSHLVINPLLGPSRDSYEVFPETQLLLGARYAIVRPEVRRVRQMRTQEPASPFRALAVFGDEGSSDEMQKLVEPLLTFQKIEHIDLAVRPQFPHLARLQKLVEAHPGRLEMAIEPGEIASKIARCHFAVTGGGTWALELACVGVPQLIVVQAEAHWPTARRLEDEGAAVCLGGQENVSSSTIRQAVQDILSDTFERQAMARCGRKLIDGRGPDRLVTALEVLLHPSRLVDFSEAAA